MRTFTTNELGNLGGLGFGHEELGLHGGEERISEQSSDQ